MIEDGFVMFECVVCFGCCSFVLVIMINEKVFGKFMFDKVRKLVK